MKFGHVLAGIFASTFIPYLAPLAAAPAAPPPTATADPAAKPAPQVPLPSGMTPLFDGKTLKGWTQIPADTWIAKNGVIASTGNGRSVLYTDEQFTRYRVISVVKSAALPQ